MSRKTSAACPTDATHMAFWPVLAAVLATLGAACTTADPSSAKPVATPTGNERDTEIKHEPCDPTSPSAVQVDINSDRRADIVHVMSNGREVCRVVDLNLDGAVDAFVYYDELGRERRRESDFDRDGRPDEITTARGGVLLLKERETNFDDRIDTWDFYEGGLLVRRERDSDGDSIIDQWWAFRDPNDPKCAVVSSDRNVDGKPDPDSVVDLCAEESGNKPSTALPPGGQAAAPLPSTSGVAPGGSAAPAPPTTSKGLP